MSNNPTPLIVGTEKKIRGMVRKAHFNGARTNQAKMLIALSQIPNSNLTLGDLSTLPNAKDAHESAKEYEENMDVRQDLEGLFKRTF